jgi:hypothetical protein
LAHLIFEKRNPPDDRRVGQAEQITNLHAGFIAAAALRRFYLAWLCTAARHYQRGGICRRQL